MFNTMIAHAVRTCILVALCASFTSAAPSITHVYPAGVQRGQSVIVTATGKFDRWPVKVWIEPNDTASAVTIEPQKDKGKFKVTAARDGLPGVVRFRVYDETGASPLRPFIIDTLPNVTEKETNDLPDKPHALPGPATVDGRLAKNGDIDTYAIKATQGQTIVASMVAHRVLGSPMDAVLQICDARGNVLIQNDDGYGLDPLATLVVPRDGTYLVRTFAFPETATSSIRHAGADTFVYRLTISNGPFIGHVTDLHTSPVDVAEGGQSSTAVGWNLPEGTARSTTALLERDDVALGALVWITQTNRMNATAVGEALLEHTGRVDASGKSEPVVLAAKKGRKVELKVESRALGFPLDARLRVADKNGKIIALVDDTDKQPDPALLFTPPADGDYTVTVSDLFGHGGFRYVYRLTARLATPDFDLTPGAAEVAFTPGKPLEVAVNIDRRHGFTGPIEVAVNDLPPGMSATAVQSHKGGSAKLVKLKLEGKTDPFNGPIVVRGKAMVGDRPIERTATVWLTVLKTK